MNQRDYTDAEWARAVAHLWNVSDRDYELLTSQGVREIARHCAQGLTLSRTRIEMTPLNPDSSLAGLMGRRYMIDRILKHQEKMLRDNTQQNNGVVK